MLVFTTHDSGIYDLCWYLRFMLVFVILTLATSPTAQSLGYIVVKEQHLAEAERVFAETGLRITCEGKRHLGAALGTRDFVVDYVQEKVANWKAKIGHLSSFAKSEPHAAYAALTHGLMSHWMFSLRSIEGIANLMQPVEEAIRLQLLPAITGRDALTDDE